MALALQCAHRPPQCLLGDLLSIDPRLSLVHACSLSLLCMHARSLSLLCMPQSTPRCRPAAAFYLSRCALQETRDVNVGGKRQTRLAGATTALPCSAALQAAGLPAASFKGSPAPVPPRSDWLLPDGSSTPSADAEGGDSWLAAIGQKREAEERGGERARGGGCWQRKAGEEEHESARLRGQGRAGVQKDGGGTKWFPGRKKGSRRKREWRCALLHFAGHGWPVARRLVREPRLQACTRRVLARVRALASLAGPFALEE